MRYLGIDYGTKWIGLAFSDKSANIAFPLSVISNDKKSIKTIKEICDKKKVNAFVIGESLGKTGKENEIMAEVKRFVGVLKKSIGLPIHFQTEIFSSAEARRFQGENTMNDASTSAIILQRFLDKNKI